MLSFSSLFLSSFMVEGQRYPAYTHEYRYRVPSCPPSVSFDIVEPISPAECGRLVIHHSHIGVLPYSRIKVQILGRKLDTLVWINENGFAYYQEAQKIRKIVIHENTILLPDSAVSALAKGKKVFVAIETQDYQIAYGLIYSNRKLSQRNLDGIIRENNCGRIPQKRRKRPFHLHAWEI